MTLRLHTSLDLLPQACEECFGHGGFFSSLPWFRHLGVTTFGDNKGVRIYVVEPSRGGGEGMAMPLLHEASRGGARRLTAAANFYTPLFVPPIRGASSGSADFDAFASALAAERPRWDVVDLRPMARDGNFDALVAAFRRAGMAVQPYFCFGNWHLPVDGRSYEQYCESLPSRMRNTLERKSKRLLKEGRLRIDIVTRPEQTAEAIAAYEKVYRSSWKQPEPFPDFIPGLIRTCAEHGWLRMGVAYVDDEAAAAQLWITYDGVASIYKLAYDEKFGGLSIGTILTARMMQQALDADRVREVDYLNGDEPYKRDWMSHRRERWGVAAFNLRTVRGLAGACRHIGGHRLRQWLRPDAA